jgi:hypothetical protein
MVGGSADADGQDDAAKNCIAAWTTSCSRDCATPKCVSNCTTQAAAMCRKNVIDPQQVFTRAVTSTPISVCATPSAAPACAPPPPIAAADSIQAAVGSTCSLISGTVSNPAFYGGQVTIYVICPPGMPAGTGNPSLTTTIIGSGSSSCVDGTFSFVATNVCGGQQTGCYGLIAATPPSSCEACGTCAAGPASTDPGWSTCTSDACPSP